MKSLNENLVKEKDKISKENCEHQNNILEKYGSSTLNPIDENEEKNHEIANLTKINNESKNKINDLNIQVIQITNKIEANNKDELLLSKKFDEQFQQLLENHNKIEELKLENLNLSKENEKIS